MLKFSVSLTLFGRHVALMLAHFVKNRAIGYWLTADISVCVHLGQLVIRNCSTERNKLNGSVSRLVVYIMCLRKKV